MLYYYVSLFCVLDMLVFKAVNLDVVFEDFIRWYLSGDWESDGVEDSGIRVNDDWFFKGRLFKRMFEYGNFWRKFWNDVFVLFVYE